MGLRSLVLPTAVLAALAVPATGLAHLYDHSPPAVGSSTPPSPAFQAGGPEAVWESLGTIPTGNPHTDLDFFTQKGETYAAVGTLGTGANGGGQTIVKLTDKGRVVPSVVAAHPSASCVSNPSAVLGLQHDVEATPKGGAILNTPNALAAPGEAQLLIDATDNEGRCHDQAAFGLPGAGAATAAPQGGLELIDVSEDVTKPKEIGLTSHVGESHTVNVDPKRPHIAFSITSDSVAVDAMGNRANDTGSSFNLDGFEVVDMSSCMSFAPGTPLATKRERCRPEVYRYRYPSAAFAQGHQASTDAAARAIFACHESEIYPDDRLACASGAATILFDLKGAFDDRGTPNDYTDDKPRGTPLPCNVRPTSTITPALITGAMITDCVTGKGADGMPIDLRVPNWLKIGAPSLEGVKLIGTAFHQGRGAGGTLTTFKADQDVDFSHEAELTGSGRYVLSTDERGGGVVPPGAACDAADTNKDGNGGVHFYATDRLRQTGTTKAEEAFASYAKTPDGRKAIYRVPIRTGAQATICTSHVLQQIPGQNRIFMAWYSQGTQVFDFVENADGTITFKEAGYFIPAGANEWSSAVFKVERNADGSFTYFGAAGDFNVGEGRSAIDLYKVRLPAPPTPRIADDARPTGVGSPERGGVPAVLPPARPGSTPAARPVSCNAAAGLRSISATRVARGLRFAFAGDGRRADVDVFQVSSGNRVLTERLVARFRNRPTRFTWSGRDTRTKRLAADGDYVVRYRLRGSRGGTRSLRLTVRRVRGRFTSQPAFEKRGSCTTLQRYKLERPVFGGRGKAPLRAAIRLTRTASVGLELLRGGRVVKRLARRTVGANRTERLRVAPTGLARGRYEVRVTVREGARSESSTLSARRL